MAALSGSLHKAPGSAGGYLLTDNGSISIAAIANWLLLFGVREVNRFVGRVVPRQRVLPFNGYRFQKRDRIGGVIRQGLDVQ
jgi:hypothetical protein